MLCCRCLKNNLHIACILIGLIELGLCLLRFGILTTHVECTCKPERFQLLCTTVMNRTRECLFIMEILESVIIIVGTDRRNPRCLTSSMVVSLCVRLMYIPILIRLFALHDFVIILILILALVPAFYFYLIVFYHRHNLIEAALEETSSV